MLGGLAGEFWLRVCHRLQSRHQLGCSPLVYLVGWGGGALPPNSLHGCGRGLSASPPGLSIGLLRAGLPQSQGRGVSGPKMETTVLLSLYL